MNLHEYQAKELLKSFQVPVPRNILARSPDEVRKAVEQLGTSPVVLKAQVHAGGRGKAGGIKLARSADEAGDLAQKMIGMKIVTHQTGPQGKLVRMLLVEEGLDIQKEYYLGLVLDRSRNRLTVMASTEGGVEIEEVAKHSPEKIVKIAIDSSIGALPAHGRKAGLALGLKGPILDGFARLLRNLYQAYVALDCTLLEINPLVLTKGGQWLALDAKMNLDDSALFRHKQVADMRDRLEEDPMEVEASKFDLSYIHLDGNIGCMVNGAGLAMSTMDIIKLHGGEPANFLDVGGGASAEKVAAAFRILVSDPKVQAILINIFGGILKCDTLAEGMLKAVKEVWGASGKVQIPVPIVVRMEGTNVELGKKMLADSGLPLIVAANLEEGARKAVEASRTGTGNLVHPTECVGEGLKTLPTRGSI
ncbi:MAG: ADP-forming succinate--CoA ligase subunit beta [Nitrospirae bacterium]|nr:ADP-forming succinate--CoA ligase subunit beta [Nitrospirota bacterium]